MTTKSRAPTRETIIRASYGAIRAMAGALVRPPETAPAQPPSRFARAQWFALPLELRQRWWAETDYGTREPSPELMAAMRRPA
jgi:hypothetical protein